MASITTVALHPNMQWFDSDEEAVLDDFADPDTVTFLFRKHGRFQVRLPVDQEVTIGRCHTGPGGQPQVDLSTYQAAAYGTSRVHASLRHDAHGWWLEDLQSSNGTWVNGEELKAYSPVHLDVRNRVLFGNLPLYILLPHKVFSGVVMPVNFDQTVPTHVVNLEGDKALQNVLQVTFQAAEPTINLHHFATGDEAMPYITANAQSIDLFILDMMLPGTINGLELASRIRALGCPGAIIFTSAETSPTSEVLISLNGEFLPKPTHILEIAPRLFNYRLGQKTAPDYHTKPHEPPIERGDVPTMRRMLPQSDKLDPQKAPEVPSSSAVQAMPPADRVDRVAAPEPPDKADRPDQPDAALETVIKDPNPLPRDSGPVKPSIRLDPLRLGRFNVPITYLQRVIAAIRRL